jgi:xanthine dehydrogenase accessory factor
MHSSADAEDVLAKVAEWWAAGLEVAVATVVHTWRSSPRPVGSQLAVASGGDFVGSVSGGCVESAVIQAGLDVLAGGEPRRLRFGVSNEQAWAVGLPCGGSIEVFVATPDGDVLARALAAREAKEPVVVATHLVTGAQRLLETGDEPPEGADDPLRLAAEGCTLREASEILELEGEAHFLHVNSPPPRLVIVGAVHLAQVVARLAVKAGFDVFVVDPRTAFATAERFPDVGLVPEWPAGALESLGVDRRTAVVTLSHDPKIDEPALAGALRSRAFYVGALGSRKSQAARRARLAEQGFDDAALGRIHGPVGLDIGARTTAEIAIAIMAEVIQRRRQPS